MLPHTQQLHSCRKKKNTGFLYAENFKNNFKDIEYKKISAKHMRSERWEFFDEKYLDKIVKLNKKIFYASRNCQHSLRHSHA